MSKNGSELISASSEDSRKQETLDTLQEIFEQNPHLMSTGARHEINKIKAGFLVLALATIAGIWAFTARSDRNLRKEINSYAAASCVGSRATLHKYNDLVNSILTTRKASLKLAIQHHNKQQEALNRAAIRRYEEDKLPIPTVKQCQQPILNQ